MSGEVAYDLIACDAHTDGSADGFPGHFPRDHVGIAGDQAGEELEDGYLEIGRGVGVDAVIGFDDDEASTAISGGSEGRRPEATGVGGEGGGEASGVEVAGVRRGLVDDAEVTEILQHIGLSLREIGFTVREAEFEGAEHEKESEDVDFIHVQLCMRISTVSCGEKSPRECYRTYALGILQIEYEHCPNLGIDLLEDESKAIFCDFHRPASKFD